MARISRACVRGAAERRGPRIDRPARAGWAALRQFLFREFFLEIFPATLVSRATRNQTDPLAPLGRRCGCWPPSPFLEFGLGAGAAAAAPDSMVWWAAPASAAGYGVVANSPLATALTLGRRLLSLTTGGTERSAEKGGVNLYGADSSRARERRSRATRSASRPTRSSRLGGASPISF